MEQLIPIDAITLMPLSYQTVFSNPRVLNNIFQPKHQDNAHLRLLLPYANSRPSTDHSS